MQFSGFYELMPGPRPWTDQRVQQVFEESLEQCLVLEDAGYERVWLTEHHFLADHAVSSAPEVFLGFLAGHTSRIRLGHGVVLTAPAINHPWRIAERTATLDQVSGGRLDVGFGRGITPFEVEGFQTDPADTRAMQLEALRVIPRMWTEETVRYSGPYYDLPEREVVPKPRQKPHPPMFIAATNPATWELAGRHGVGVMSFGFAAPELLKEATDAWERGKADPDPVSSVVNTHKTAQVFLYCGRTDEEALDCAYESMAMQLKVGLRYLAQWNALQPGAAVEMQEFMERVMPGITDESKHSRVIQDLIDRGVLFIGGPATLRDKVRRYIDAGMDELAVLGQFGRMQHKDIIESYRRFSSEVVTAFA
jgi:alkanesulfonate monooxygenase SsuD/methylene tetrahydromethanopterin reductase-like flavin-dependent oxidoreductase (luciferase family)